MSFLSKVWNNGGSFLGDPSGGSFGFDKVTGSNPSKSWRSFKDWFSGQKSADISSAAQIRTSAALNEQQKDLDVWRALNLPAAQMEGYRAAGLNPILVGNQSPSVVSSHQASVSAGNSKDPLSIIGGVSQLIGSAKEMATFSNDVKASKEMADTVRQERRQSEIQTKLDAVSAMSESIRKSAFIEATTGVRNIGVDDALDLGDDPDAKKAYTQLVQSFRNAIERDRYLNSREHAIYEDAINTGKAAGEVIKNVRAPVKPDQRRFYNSDNHSIRFTDQRGNRYHDIRK